MGSAFPPPSPLWGHGCGQTAPFRSAARTRAPCNEQTWLRTSLKISKVNLRDQRSGGEHPPCDACQRGQEPPSHPQEGQGKRRGSSKAAGGVQAGSSEEFSFPPVTVQHFCTACFNQQHSPLGPRALKFHKTQLTEMREL